jgi:putative endonuclease
LSFRAKSRLAVLGKAGRSREIPSSRKNHLNYCFYKPMLKRKYYNFYIYILSSTSGTLYIGVTNNLKRRIMEHKKLSNNDSFTKKYSCFKLVYYECFSYVNNAINREKQIKRWSRKKKIELINNINPHWLDLTDNL